MRIAVNARFLMDPLEGVGQYSFHILRNLVLTHPEDQFHFFFDRPYDPKFIFAENVRPHVISPPARHPILWYLWFEYQLPKYLKRIQANVFFSPDGFASLRSNTPTLLTCHDLAYINYPDHIKCSHLIYSKCFIPKFLKKAARISCVSTSVTQEITDHFKICPEKIFVASNAANPSYKPISKKQKSNFQKTISEGCPYFLYLGSIHPRKNISGLIKAFEIFKANSGSKHKLILAGRWAWKTSTIESQLKNSPYHIDIILLNSFDSYIHDLVAAADAMVYVSLYEGFGLPIIESMASGVPVICSDRGAMKELAGENALKVNPENLESIAEAMTQIHQNNELALELGQKGVARATQYSWEKSAEIIYAHLKLIASSA